MLTIVHHVSFALAPFIPASDLLKDDVCSPFILASDLLKDDVCCTD